MWAPEGNGSSASSNHEPRGITGGSAMKRRSLLFLTWCSWFLLAVGASTVAEESGPDPLASWNTGATKTALLEFVARVIREGGPGFVPPAERIAVFDQDGTLWAEQPLYVQLTFAIERVRALAP